MKFFKYVIPVAALALFTFCKSSENNGKANNTGVGTLPPVETNSPNTDYKPAFEGQTRAAGVKTATPFEVKVISEGLARPWSIVPLPDGRLLITEKAGSMLIATADGKLSSKITGIPAVNSGGQGGLQGLTLSPDFKTSRLIYFVFSENAAEGTVAAIAKAKLSADESKLENVQVIYRALPSWKSTGHYGGRLIFDKDGNIFFGAGERSNVDSRVKAQSLDNAFGKVVHITPEGKPVANGPFAKTAGAFPEIYSYGHRNPLGIDLHPATGDLWVVEMGPRGGDELNLIKPGKNYGWPAVTYGIEYSGATIGEGITQRADVEQPVYYWDPVISPGGMKFYRSSVIPEWENNLFITGLSSKHVIRLVIKNNKVVGEERIMEGEGQRVRDITEYKGMLFAVTDEGRLYKISKK